MCRCGFEDTCGKLVVQVHLIGYGLRRLTFAFGGPALAWLVRAVAWPWLSSAPPRRPGKLTAFSKSKRAGQRHRAPDVLRNSTPAAVERPRNDCRIWWARDGRPRPSTTCRLQTCRAGCGSLWGGDGEAEVGFRFDPVPVQARRNAQCGRRNGSGELRGLVYFATRRPRFLHLRPLSSLRLASGNAAMSISGAT